jgi:hypothetical protein
VCVLLGVLGKAPGAGRDGSSAEGEESQRRRDGHGRGPHFRCPVLPRGPDSTSAVRGERGDHGLLAPELLRRGWGACGVEQVSQCGVFGSVVAGDQLVGLGVADPLASPVSHRM